MAISPYSVPSDAQGQVQDSVEMAASEACSLTGVEMYGAYSKEDQLIRDFNEAQRMVSKGRDWVFELTEDESIPLVQGETNYDISSITPTLKYPLNYQGFLSVKVGNRPLSYLDPEDMDARYAYVKSSALATAIVAGDTSVVLENSSSFPDSGTVQIGENLSVQYSANDKSTNTLSGIPASGTGSITDAAPAGRSVFFGIAQSYPTAYTVYDGVIKLNCPVNLQTAGIDFKFRYLRRLPTMTSFQDQTLIPFYEEIPYFIASKIERRKRNYDDADRFEQQFLARVAANAEIYKMPQEQNYYRYNLMNNTNVLDNWFGSGWDETV